MDSVAYLFEGCTSLTYVRLPETLSCIDVGAFKNCTQLHSIWIDSNETVTVPAGAFEGCDDIQCVFIKSGVEVYGLTELGLVEKGAVNDGTYHAWMKPIDQES